MAGLIAQAGLANIAREWQLPTLNAPGLCKRAVQDSPSNFYLFGLRQKVVK
jgi:hypothetical protein